MAEAALGECYDGKNRVNDCRTCWGTCRGSVNGEVGGSIGIGVRVIDGGVGELLEKV